MNKLRCIFFKSVVLIFCTYLLFMASGCESPTKIKKGVISGRIILFEEEDHSGIAVSVFNAGVVPDDTFKQERDEYIKELYWKAKL